MNIILSQNSSKPIYEQIVEQIKKLILSGSLNANDALPSMRLLAKELRVSLITTKRAYEELERSGYIYTVAGKGCFVRSGNHETIYNEHKPQLVGTKRKANKVQSNAFTLLTKKENGEIVDSWTYFDSKLVQVKDNILMYIFNGKPYIKLK